MTEFAESANKPRNRYRPTTDEAKVAQKVAENTIGVLTAEIARLREDRNCLVAAAFIGGSIGTIIGHFI